MARALLGDRHQQAVGVLGVVAAERVARVDALRRAARDHAAHAVEVGQAERDRELAHHGLGVHGADALDREQRVAGVGGPAHEQLGQLDEAATPQPGEIDDARERIQRLRRADVGGRLLAADVLLARLQREHEAAPSVDVARLAGDPAGHAPQVLLARREEAERRAAEVEAVAEALALADADVDAVAARRLEDPERDRVGAADDERPVGARRRDQRLELLDRAEEVRRRDEGGADVIAHRRSPLRGVGHAVAQADLDDRGAVARRERAQRLARVRVHAARDDEPRASVGQLREVAGRRERRRALVHRRVGDVHPGQLADRGLELEHHLQAALRDLRLVGRVRGQELRARHQHVDDRGDVVVVEASPQEGELLLGAAVARGELAQVRVHLRLAAAGRQFDLAAQAHGGGDLGEELLDRSDADRLEHRGAVVVGDGGVARHRCAQESSATYASRVSSAAVCAGSERRILIIQPSP